MSSEDKLVVGLAQISPVWLDRDATIGKVIESIEDAGSRGCDLIAFGEALVPGYPSWLSATGGARFNDDFQKDIHAHYLDQAVDIEAGHLESVCEAAKAACCAVYLGIIEHPRDRGQSLYCSFVFINANGEIGSVHRKLQPTYEERLAWSQGDGHGLRTHPLGRFTVGGLNCWENWMPLPRAALYGMGEDLHVACWPGGNQNTQDITPMLAREGRSYMMSVSCLLRRADFPANLPHRDQFLAAFPEETIFNGGSCLAAPDGSFVIAPQIGEEGLFIAEIDHAEVRRERQNFDPAGHYSRPDVFKLEVTRNRQTTLHLRD